jgi:hypothetical protein
MPAVFTRKSATVSPSLPWIKIPSPKSGDRRDTAFGDIVRASARMSADRSVGVFMTVSPERGGFGSGLKHQGRHLASPDVLSVVEPPGYQLNT